jgi:peptidoglycan/LPS O-acetylase OafA/YrhL
VALQRPYAYQPALDGLRAVAIIVVLLYHGQVGWVPGGFFGVDLFFVLSGYLITTLLLAEWQGHGRIDLKGFWARRARRLLPALFLMLAAVAAYGALLAPAAGRARLRWDGLATLAYVANWRFASSRLPYFAQFGDPSPLTHMWSLGIEEQYYLAWPLLLLGLLGLARRRAQRGLATPVLGLVLLGALASALLMAALYQPGSDPSRVYYGTDTRAQALLLGGALAIALGRLRRPLPRVLADSLGVAGLAGLGAMVLRVPDSATWLYRGGFALAALAAAGAVVAAVQPEGDGRVRELLSLEPLPAIGRVSYGLYLWHWPVAVTLSPDRTHLDGFPLLLLRLLVTSTVALLSYFLLEQPIRQGALRRRGLARPATTGAVVGLAALLVLATASGPGAGAEGATLHPGTGPASLTAVTPPASAAQAGRQRGGSGFRVFLVGDSVAFTLGYNYRQGTVPGMTLGGDTEIGCGIARAPSVNQGQVQPVDPKCTTWPTRWRAAAAAFHPDVSLLLIGAWEVLDKQVGGRTLHAGTPDAERYLDSELQLAVDILAPVSHRVAILDVPCFDEPETADAYAWIAKARNDPARVAWINQALGRFAAAHRDKVALLDLHGFLCPGGRDTSGTKVRYDGVHFTAAGANLVWGWLGPQLYSLARQ